MKFSRSNVVEKTVSNAKVKSVANVSFSKYAIPEFNGLKENKVDSVKISGDFSIPENIVLVEEPVSVEQVVEKSHDESWEKFVDAVIIPTLNSCMDKVKKFIDSDLRDDLKNSKPEIRE